MITPRDVGRRVVVRRVVGTRDGRPRFSDVLGELRAVDERGVTVRDSSGRDVTVPWERVAAAKPVPERQPRARDVVALERTAAAGWPAVETRRLGDWLLRSAEGWTSRANSVLVLGNPGLPLSEALGQVHEWYAARGQAPRFSVPLPTFRAFDGELARRGWPQTHEVLVQTAPLQAVLAALPELHVLPEPDDQPESHVLPEPHDLPPVRLAATPDADWLAVAASRKGSLPAVAVRVLTGARLPIFASVYESGNLVATGRGVVDDGWLGLSLLEVAPPARRRGLGRHVVGALARWAAGHGARRCYLQVESDNEPAVALYAGLGFTTHHRYAGRTAP